MRFGVGMGRVGLAASLLLAATGLLAQATGTTTADLRGLVTDEAGSALPGVTIIATSQDSGLSRQDTSDSGGAFAIRLLPPGLYRVSASLPGLRAAEISNVRLSVGATTTLELHLEPSEVSEAVLVTAETSLIDRSSMDLYKTIGETEIRNLPINQRNFLEFALTTPGVTAARGPQIGAFPTSGISINGQNPRYNNFVVDGLDNNDPAVGSVRSTFSQEAVREYQVIQSPLSAEYGKATGGIVNVVTRSGSNAWHGAAFAFYRDENLSSNNFLTGSPTPFQQAQYGASLSGPILRDRLFFFATAERLTVDDANVVTIEDADVALIRSQGFEIQNGVVPFDRNGTSVLGKLDLLPSPSHAFSLRGTYARSLNENQQAWGGLTARSSGGVGSLEDAAVAITGTSILTANLSNELRALYADRSQRLDPLDPNRGPQVTIQGVATFGTQRILPQPRDTQVYQIFDAVSWSGNRSAYKAGFDYTHTAFAGSAPGSFAGTYQFSALRDGPGVPAGGLSQREAFAAGLPYNYSQGFGDPYWRGATNYLGVFAQGEWTVQDRLLLRLGLRYDYEAPADPLPSDGNNWAPRFSLSWAAGDAWRVRGGAGRFYGVAALIPMFAISINDGVQTTYTGRVLGEGSPEQSPSVPWDLPGRRFPDATSAGTSQYPQPVVRPAGCESAMPPNLDLEACAEFQSAYTDQANVGFELEVGRHLLVNVDYLYARGRNILESRNINPLIDGGPDRPNPDFAAIVVDSAFGNSWYDGVTVGLQTQSGSPFQMSAFYTYADGQDDYIDWLTPIQLQDPLDPQEERGQSIHVPKHKATLTAIYTTVGRSLPWYARDWTIATIVDFVAGRPFNITAGFDRNGNGDPVSDRPEGVARNSGRLPNVFNVDVRLARTLPVGAVALEATLDVFNLFNRENVLEVNSVRYLNNQLKPNPQYGAVTMVADPRRIQFGLRASF